MRRLAITQRQRAAPPVSAPTDPLDRLRQRVAAARERVRLLRAANDGGLEAAGNLRLAELEAGLLIGRLAEAERTKR